MNIETITGDIFEVDTNVIIQQVNCQGVMGSGLALQIKSKYPKVFDTYKRCCANGDDEQLLGLAQIVEVADDKYVINLYGQRFYGTRGRYTNYAAFEKALNQICFMCKYHEDIKTISFPEGIGCGLGGGDWTIIYKMICEAFKDVDDLTVQIVKYDK